MGINIRIEDGKGRGEMARVEDRALLTTTYPTPPLIEQKTVIFSQSLTDDGLSTGNTSLLVDGSITPVEFWIPADESDDRYITQLNILVVYPSPSAKFAEFADDGGALTNGFTITYERDDRTIQIDGDLKTNGDFMRLSTPPNFTEVRSMLLVNDYGYSVNLDLTKVMPPLGVKLDGGTLQRFILTVNDDITASNATLMDAFAYGFDRFK